MFLKNDEVHILHDDDFQAKQVNAIEMIHKFSLFIKIFF